MFFVYQGIPKRRPPFPTADLPLQPDGDGVGVIPVESSGGPGSYLARVVPVPYRNRPSSLGMAFAYFVASLLIIAQLSRTIFKLTVA